MLAPGRGFLHATPDPAQLSAWLNAADLAHTVAEFQRTGFRGGLNWYRAIRPSRELLTARRSINRRCSSAASATTCSGSTPRAAIGRFAQTLPGLRGCRVLEGAGHWVQRERAEAVNAVLVGFLKGL